MNKNDRGSFLIEMIFVLAIMGVILSVAVLDMDIVYKLRLNKEVEEFKRDIDSLRMNSLKKATRSNLVLDGIENSYRLKTKEKGKVSYRIIKTVYPKYFKIVSNNFEYSFLQTGAVNKGGTIKLRHKYGVWDITISPVTGKTNLKK